MPAYEVLPAYENLNPKTPKPADGGVPYFITAQEGVPVIYSEDTIPTCGVRLLHPSNVNAPSKGLALSILFVPPMSKMEIHNHEAEECYIIQSGSGEMLFKGGSRPVKVGDYIYLPSWCDHGIVNNGTEILVVLLALTPPNP